MWNVAEEFGGMVIGMNNSFLSHQMWSWMNSFLACLPAFHRAILWAPAGRVGGPAWRWTWLKWAQWGGMCRLWSQLWWSGYGTEGEGCCEDARLAGSEHSSDGRDPIYIVMAHAGSCTGTAESEERGHSSRKCHLRGWQNPSPGPGSCPCSTHLSFQILGTVISFLRS